MMPWYSKRVYISHINKYMNIQINIRSFYDAIVCKYANCKANVYFCRLMYEHIDT